VKTETEIADEQAGFRQGRGTVAELIITFLGRAKRKQQARFRFRVGEGSWKTWPGAEFPESE